MPTPINPHRTSEVAEIVNDFQMGHSVMFLARRYGKPRAAIETIIRKFTAPGGRRGGYAAEEQRSP